MIASQEGDPTKRLLEEIFQLAVDDVRYQNPTACTKNELQETKRTAEDFFKTKFYHELCDLFKLHPRYLTFRQQSHVSLMPQLLSQRVYFLQG